MENGKENIEKKLVKVSMYENLDFLGFLEAKLRENRKLPQTRPQKSDSMQNFGKFWYKTLLALSGAYTTFSKLPI